MANLDKLVVELQLETAGMKAQLEAAEGQIRRLAGNVGAASAPVDKLRGSFQKLGSTLGATFAAAATLTFLKNSAKAASEDAKSQVVLEGAMRRVTGASLEQFNAVDQQLSKLSMMTNEADDNLRPALATLIRSTGDTDKAMQQLNLALDIAADTGRDVGSVSLILARANSGNLQSLNKLLPGIKGTTDWMGKLTDSFDGAAEAAANKDPLTKLQITFGEMQETVGRTLLPYLKGFADWFVSIQPLVAALIPIVMGIVAGFVTWKVATTAVTIAMALYNGVVALSTIATTGFTVALASTGIGAIAIAVGLLVAGLMALNTQMDTAATERPTGNAYDESIAAKVEEGATLAGKKAKLAFEKAYKITNPESYRVMMMGLNPEVEKSKQIAIDKAYKIEEARLRALYAKETIVPVKTMAADTKLKEYLKSTQAEIAKLVKTYNDKVKNLTKDYQDALTKRIQDFKSAFSEAVSFNLRDMYMAGAQSGTALVDGLKTKLEGIKNFSSDIAKLTAAGFTSDFTQQIVEAGPILGSEMSKAILSSSPEVQAQLKQLFADTQDATTNGVDFIGNSIVSEFKSASDALTKALTELATALNASLEKVGTKLNTKLLGSTSKELKDASTEIGNTRNVLNGSYANGAPTPSTVTSLNQGALNNAGVNSTFQINTTALSNASPEMITQTIVNGIKFGLPTLAGAVE
jgi:DNA anti-recombination protein RmuC